jgi:ribosome-associated protein
MPKLVPKKDSAPLECLPHVLRIADIIAGFKGRNIRAFDMRGLTLLADCFILCSATSDPQLKAIYNGVKEGMRDAGLKTYYAEGEFSGNWLVLDFGTILVHIFRGEAYEFYDLEGLWGDAPEIDLQLEPMK